MLCDVVSSARCKARKLDKPVPSMSGIVDPRGSYRRLRLRLERLHVAGNFRPSGTPLYLIDPADDRQKLAGIIRIRGVAATLQRVREGAHVRAGTQSGGVARVA